MADLDAQAIALVVRYPGKGLVALTHRGITEEHLHKDYQPIWRYLRRCIDKNGNPPSKSFIESKFSLRLPEVSKSDLRPLVESLDSRYRYNSLLEALESTATSVSSYDDVDASIEKLRTRLDQINGQRTNGHLLDAFSNKAMKLMIQEIETRRNQPTMLTRFPTIDAATGGFRPGQLVVVAGRPSQGKSYLSLWLLFQALKGQFKTLMYSLEMPETEVLARLHTITTRCELGPEESLRNMDLVTGRVSTARYVEAVKKSRARYRKLFHLVDFKVQCTLDQIDSDLTHCKPDVCLIDYLTLMPRPARAKEGWEAVRELSGGLKRLAIKHKTTIIACAQLNRMAEGKEQANLSTIAASDSIGQDADLVITLASGKNKILLQIPKNRHGARIVDPVHILYAPDEGWLEEVPSVDDDD